MYSILQNRKLNSYLKWNKIQTIDTPGTISKRNLPIPQDIQDIQATLCLMLKRTLQHMFQTHSNPEDQQTAT